jgi:hypothetical protein
MHDIDSCDRLYHILPTSLANHVSEYTPSHRAWMMAHVLEELHAYHNTLLCESCERLYDRRHLNSVSVRILGATYAFCCKECASEGEWSLRYDYRKARRWHTTAQT